MPIKAPKKIEENITEFNGNQTKDSKGIVDDSEKLKSDGGEHQITVACRIRPLTEEEILLGSSLIGHKIADDNMIVLMDPAEDHDDILRANRSREKQFVFDMAFDAKSTQQEVFEKTTKNLLPGVINGYNATVFAYGATGAGKTYTMLGTEEEPGIMFRTLHELFIEISNKSNNSIYQVSMSYLEIYNELIRDLLNPSNGFLELREDAKGGIQIAGISELVAETPQEVMYMLHKGNKERTQEPTKANKTSSRSHAVLQVNIKQRDKVRLHSQEIRLGKLYMIDLAGSERAAQTQNTGKRMVEGAHINRSLLALGNCINALSEKGNSKYVNYRDSKLTRILKDSLGGNSKTVMIAHISPASLHFEESRNTLVYADRAKFIRTKIRRNVIDVSYHISQYQQIIQELAQEIAVLKDQRYDLESRISNLDPKIGNSNIGINQIAFNSEEKSKIEDHLKLRESLLQAFKQQIKLRKNILELDNAIMDISIEAERHNKIIQNWKSGDKASTSKSPDEVINSKRELKVVEQDREELEAKHQNVSKELEAIRIRTRKLRDQATKKLTNQEQKEILNLLLKNFEFEMKNIEMQANLFKRDFKIREQDMIILRLEQHRSLCDTLIYQQRQLIVQNDLKIPHDLDELFTLYARDVNEGQLYNDINGIRSASNSSLINVSPKSSNTPFLTQIEEENNDFFSTTHTFSNKTLNRNNYIKNTSNSNQLLRKENDFLQRNKNSNRKTSKEHNTSSFKNPNNFGSVTTGQQLQFNARKNLSNISNSTNESNNMEILLENFSADKQSIKTTANNSKNNRPFEPPGHVESPSFRKNEDAKRLTQGIAAKAAQRKAFQHHKDLMHELGHQENSDYSSHNPSLNTNLTPSRLARHDQIYGINDDLLGEKKNSFLTDTTNKTKKQVKIKEVVEFKLPDDKSNDTKHLMRRNSFDSATALKKTNHPKGTKKIGNDSKKPKSLNNQHSPKKTNNNSVSLNSVNNGSNLSSRSNGNSLLNIENSTNSKNNQNKQVPTIPNNTKGIDLSLLGTSVLS
ncbi:Kinesin KIF19, partial [Brachionus plicatilis]